MPNPDTITAKVMAAQVWAQQPPLGRDLLEAHQRLQCPWPPTDKTMLKFSTVALAKTLHVSRDSVRQWVSKRRLGLMPCPNERGVCRLSYFDLRCLFKMYLAQELVVDETTTAP